MKHELSWVEQHLAESGETNLNVEFEYQVLTFTHQMCRVMDEQRISRSELADRLKKQKSYVTRVLNGNANFTLRTMVQFAGALGGELNLSINLKEAIVLETPDE